MQCSTDNVAVMICKTFNILIFDFELHVILDVSNTELDELRAILEDFDAPDDEIHYYIEAFENSSMDGVSSHSEYANLSMSHC